MPKYHLRKKEREIKSQKEIEEILQKGKFVSIALCRNNEPYVVSLNYGYDKAKNVLYFHCAKEGLKLDFIKENPNVCATVIEDLGYVKDECEQFYRSVVFWGKMSVVDDLQEKKYGIEILLKHLEDNPDKVRQKTLKDDKAYEDVGILRLDITEITGKKRK